MSIWSVCDIAFASMKSFPSPACKVDVADGRPKMEPTSRSRTQRLSRDRNLYTRVSKDGWALDV
jgi:hypothetical protein